MFALYIGTGVGAVVPAGTVMGYGEIVFVGSEQFPVSATTDPTPVTLLAVVGSVLPFPFVNVVEVASIFQPFPVSVSSSGVNVSDTLLVWFVPFSVTLDSDADVGAAILNDPPEQSTVWVTIFDVLEAYVVSPL